VVPFFYFHNIYGVYVAYKRLTLIIRYFSEKFRKFTYSIKD